MIAERRDDNRNRREDLKRLCDAASWRVVELTQQLVRVPSGNPPGDTRQITGVIAEVLSAIPGADIEVAESQAPISNVIARVRGSSSGRRLVLNGHLDTFPVGEMSQWSVDPFEGEIRNGRLYGRGSSDMKAGLAASIFACQMLSEVADAWSGEVVLTFAGDEETMGDLGTRYLLDQYDYAAGDAMLSGDAGSPIVLRFGEKGLLWLELSAKGRSSHGAHVHLGENAIERLILAMYRLTDLRDIKPEIPGDVDQAMALAREPSEALSGVGEQDVLRSITVNFGTITGGSAPNLVADYASTNVDIRVPAGIAVGDIEAEVERTLGALPGISYKVTNRFDATWTAPDSEVVTSTASACAEIFGAAPAVNMRVGASDSRHYRARGIPTVVCGATPHGMGGPDEYVDVHELKGLGQVFALAAYDFLSSEGECA